MAIFSQYGTGQRIGFVIVCIGFAFCLIGSIAPYWITAKVPVDVVGRVDIQVGIWYYCVDWALGQKCSSLYDAKDGSEWINAVRFLIVVTVVLGLSCGIIACCRCMCCSGGRTVCHGVLSFFAGGIGLCSFGIFESKTNSLLAMKIEEIDYGWALSLFVIGSALMIIASFVLCCAMPREPNYGMVMLPSAAPSVSVNVSNTNSNINQYNAGGPIHSFQPLPQAPGPAPHPHPHGYQPMPQPSGSINSPPAYDYNHPGPVGNYNHPSVMPPAGQHFQ